MEERGIDISGHRSTPVDEADLGQYTLILVMERGHQESLRWEFPEIAERVHLISEMTDEVYEVSDPVTGSLTDYTHTAEVLKNIVYVGYQRIRELARIEDRNSQD